MTNEWRRTQVVARIPVDHREEAHRAAAALGTPLADIQRAAIGALIRAPRLTVRVLRLIRRTDGTAGGQLEAALDRIESGGSA